MTWKLGCKSSPSPKSSAVAFSCILVFCLRWPTREYGNAHTSLCIGIGGKECSKGGKSVSVNSERFTCSFPILPECGRQVSFGHIRVPAPVCLCWAPALGGWDWWQLFVFTFSPSPSRIVDVEGTVTALKIALVWETQHIFKLGFFSL